MEAIMSLSLGEAVKYIVGILAALSVFVEFTPIKLHPISAILNWIGKRTNKEVNKDIKELNQELLNLRAAIDDISTQQKKLEADMQEGEAINCRLRILQFADELRRGVKHSKESFDQVMADIDTYEKYCYDHPKFRNNKTVVSTDRITSAYNDRCEMNDFL